jgi:tRNA pseudouridine55 synthase
VADPDGVLLLDKAAGYSSTQALARAKRLLGARKAGHTGTLDPFATGLLPLAFGEATKFSRFLIDSAKTYEATLHLGMVSTTGDPEGSVSRRADVKLESRQIDEVLASFVGVQQQTPPMHSAIHVDGRRLYELAREGIEVVRKPRRVEIQAIRKVSLAGDLLVVSVTCSKGTYIRTLGADIGDTLGCGAYLTALRRTAVGEFRLADGASLEQLEGAGIEGARAKLLPLEVMIAGLPRWEGAGEDALHFTQGQRIACPAAAPGAEFAVFEPAGRFLGVGRCEQPGLLAPLRLLATGAGVKSPDFA